MHVSLGIDIVIAKVKNTNTKILRFTSVWVPNMLNNGALFIC